MCHSFMCVVGALFVEVPYPDLFRACLKIRESRCASARGRTGSDRAKRCKYWVHSSDRHMSIFKRVGRMPGFRISVLAVKQNMAAKRP